MPPRSTATPADTPAPQAPAVTRAVAILKLLAGRGEPMGVNAVARELGVAPSSCLHILRALAEDGLVQADPRTKQYSLGLGLLTLAHDMLGRNHFAALVQPELERIARDYGATATAVELDSRERMVVVAVAQAPTIVQIQVGVGSRFPAFISATGRCVASRAGLNRAQLRQRFSALKWHAAPAFDAWLAEIEAAGRDGYAVDRGNYIGGITIVASLVGEDGPAERAISIVAVSEQLGDKRLVALEGDTREAARRVTARLRGL